MAKFTRITSIQLGIIAGLTSLITLRLLGVL